MNTAPYRLLPAALLVTFGLAVSPIAVHAQEAEKKAEPAAAEGQEKDKDQPDLQKILERLNKVEKELLDLRIKSGKVPADKKDQRIITLLETPYLGSVYYGSPTNQRFLAVKLMVVNLTDQPQTLKRDDVKLSSDGQVYPIKDAPQQYQYHQFQIGQQSVQLRSLQTPAQVQLSAGGTGSTWLLFPDLPPGSHVPQMTIKLKFGDMEKDIDVNATQRDVLGIKVERIGPRGALGLISLGGAMNTINVGSLVDEIDRLAGDKVARVVIRWVDGGSLADQQLLNWLQNAAAVAGRMQPQQEMQFPSFPTSIRELHLAALPNPNGNNGGVQQYYGNYGANAADRIHKTEVTAVISSLRTAYESLPRDEVLQTIQSGSKLERAAALAGGAGRLGADKLPVILKLADDNDPVLQQAALAALSHFGEKEAIEKLVEYAKKNTEPVSPAAIAGLAGSRYADAHVALLQLLGNESPEAKKNIVKILAAFPRPVWSDAIYEFVKDARSGLNVEALNALVQVGHPKLVPVLDDALKGNDQNLKQQAFNILVNRTDKESEDIAIAYTLEQLKTVQPSPQMLQLLNRVKDKRAVPLLLTHFVKSQNKSGLIQTLTLIGDQETAKFLVEKYPSLQNHEKGELLRALSRLDIVSFRKLASQALLSSDGSMVSYAVQGLQEDGGPEAVKIMIEAFDAAGQSFTWSYLSNALATVGTPAARTALIKARDSGNAEKRNYAVNALQMLRQRSPGFQYIYQGQQFSKQEKWKEAIEQFDLALQLDPNLPDAYAERGNIYLRQEKTAEAGKDFAKAAELDPFNSQAVTGQCIVMAMEGKIAEAVKKLDETRPKFPNNSLFNYNAACVFGRAVEHLQKNEKAADREKLIAQYTQSGLDELKKSIELGMQDFEWMKKDPDLKPFRELPEFQKLATPSPEGPGKAKAAAARRAARGVALPAAFPDQ